MGCAIYIPGENKEAPKIGGLVFSFSFFFPLSLSFFLFCQFNSTQDKLKTASEAEEGEWCEAVNGGCMGIFDEIEKMEKKLKDMVRLGFCWISTQVTPMVRFLLDLDASSPDKYLTRGQ